MEYTQTKDGWLKDWQPGFVFSLLKVMQFVLQGNFGDAMRGIICRWIGIVHDAEPTVTIPVMSYEIAAELAHFGKKVLHPSTVYVT